MANAFSASDATIIHKHSHRLCITDRCILSFTSITHVDKPRDKHFSFTFFQLILIKCSGTVLSMPVHIDSRFSLISVHFRHIVGFSGQHCWFCHLRIEPHWHQLHLPPNAAHYKLSAIVDYYAWFSMQTPHTLSIRRTKQKRKENIFKFQMEMTCISFLFSPSFNHWTLLSIYEFVLFTWPRCGESWPPLSEQFPIYILSRNCLVNIE